MAELWNLCLKIECWFSLQLNVQVITIIEQYLGDRISHIALEGEIECFGTAEVMEAIPEDTPKGQDDKSCTSTVVVNTEDYH